MLKKNISAAKKLNFTLKQDTADTAYQQIFDENKNLIFEGDDYRIEQFITMTQAIKNLEDVGYKIQTIIN